MKRQDLQTLLFDVDLALVDLAIGEFNLGSERFVPLQERPHRHLHLVFHQPAER